MTTHNKTIGRVSNGISTKSEDTPTPKKINDTTPVKKGGRFSPDSPITTKTQAGIIGHREFTRRLKEQILKIRGIVNRSNREITIKFIPPETLAHSPTIHNQILIRYSSGKLELLPQGVNGHLISKYLGVQATSIKEYAIVPLLEPLTKINTNTIEFFGAKL